MSCSIMCVDLMSKDHFDYNFALLFFHKCVFIFICVSICLHLCKCIKCVVGQLRPEEGTGYPGTRVRLL